MSMAQLKYFFSYARKDTEFVLKLATELRAVGVDVWLDQLDILGGQRWDRAIENALEACQGIIAVLSPESLASNNVMDEVSYALEKGKLVVPILLRPCDIPFRLRLVQHVNFVADYDLGFRQLLRALRVEQPTVTTEPRAVKTQVAQELAEPSAVTTEPPAVKTQVAQKLAQQPAVTKEAPAVKTQVAQKLAEPSAVTTEPPAVKTQVGQELTEPLTETTTKIARQPASGQRTQPMLWRTIIVILLVLWLLGLVVHVGGGLIHIVLLAAVIVMIYNLVSGRQRSEARITSTPEPASPASGALARHATLYGILLGAAAGAIWGLMATLIFDPYFKSTNCLIDMAIVGAAGAITGAICRMRWKVIVIAIAGSLVVWLLWAIAVDYDRPNMTDATIGGTSFGAILGSVAGVMIGKWKGWK